MTTPSKAPVWGDVIVFVDDDGKEHKASVLDAALQDLPKERGKGQGIKIQVVPADNSPFPVVAAYHKGGKAGTWHYPGEGKKAEPEEGKDDES